MASRDKNIETGTCFADSTHGEHYYMVRDKDTLHINNTDGSLINTLERDFVYDRPKLRRVPVARFKRELTKAVKNLNIINLL